MALKNDLASVRIHIKWSEHWIQAGQTFARGSAFIDGRKYDASDLVSRFSGIRSKSEFKESLTDLDGFFTVVHSAGSRIFAAVDRARTTPLYYSSDGRFISDDADWVRAQIGGTSFDPLATLEFLTTRYAFVTGQDTLLPDVLTLLPGELMVVDREDTEVTISTEDWFRYYPNGGKYQLDESEPIDRLDTAITHAFDRLIEYADGRPIAIPLSGGFDSRLALLTLCRLGYDDLYAFTFGKAGAGDVRVANEVTENVGVDWTFIEYSRDRWFEWFNSENRAAYYDMAFNFDAIPVIEPWPAMGELRKNDSIPADSVIAPGLTVAHCSTSLPPDIIDDSADGDTLANSFIEKYYRRGNLDESTLLSTFGSRVRNHLHPFESGDANSALLAYEDLYWRNIRKYQAVTSRVFDFWDYDWWFPLYDTEVIRTWASLPMEDRSDRKIYEFYTNDLYEEIGGVSVNSVMVDPYESRPLLRFIWAIGHSPLKPLASRLYRTVWQQVIERYPMAAHYKDPEGLYGMFPEELFARLYSVHESQHSLRAMEALGLVSFDQATEKQGAGDIVRSTEGDGNLTRQTPATGNDLRQ